MTKLEDKIKYYEGRVDDLTAALGGTIYDREREVKEAMMGCYKTILSDLQSLTESHRAEIEEAYAQGDTDRWDDAHDRIRTHQDAADYYEKTYGPERFKKEGV